jgi:EAL domain-containing protein (putative c-di-GMP-specific phosphodiesterase class I)
MADPAFKVAQQNNRASGDKPLRERAAAPGGAQFGPKELDVCLDNRHFRVEYQPKVALLSNQTSQFGVEALCRVTDPVFGPVSPDKFIAIAEANGLIYKLTDAVSCDAFRAWQGWNVAGLPLRLALNVSPLLLGDSKWFDFFLQRCAEFRMDPKWITLEITETAAGATGEQAGEILRDLHAKGFKLSIDDFGTGFSSLSTLYRLPISEMKIDKSFVLEMDRNPGAREVVESAVAMAKRMGIKVVAEGVETEKNFEELRRMGCDEVQGFFVGKSLPTDAIVPFFTDWKKSRGAAPAARQLPKIAFIQALLNDLANDIATPAPVKAGPYAALAVPGIPDDRLRELVLKIPPLVLGGKTVPALATCHEAIRALEKTPGGHAPCSRVGQLQAHLESELLCGGKLEIRTPRRNYRLLPQGSVTLGRPSPTATPDIPVQCRWFNTADRSLRIFRKDGQYFVEDTGSRHGHLVDGAKLEPGQPFALPSGNTIVEICLASGGQAPVSLLLQRRFYDQDAVVVEFDYDEETLLADLGAVAWPALKQQLETSWIVFNGPISLGRASECAIVLRNCATLVAAAITFEDGYWIAPADGAPFRAGDTAFQQRLPLLLNAELDLAGALVTARRAEAAQSPGETGKVSRA